MHLISPEKLKETFPLHEKEREFISTSRRTLENILQKTDPRILLIVGPCSIHNPEEGLIFAEKIKKLAEEVKESAFLLMRAYIEKPRTSMGWKGLVYDPDLDGSEKINEGLEISRSFLLELAKMQVPAATEFLTPHLSPYFEDLITWGCIGARTTTSQIHRTLASYLSIPIGFKNTVDGNISAAIQGAVVARFPHHFVHLDEKGNLCTMQSEGNPYTHIVLRGSTLGTNYDSQTIGETIQELKEANLRPNILVDCSHGNAEGNYQNQIGAFISVLKQIQEGNTAILGMMIESNLEAGSQKISPFLEKGVSITDPCIDFDQLSELVRSIAISLNQSW